MMCKTAQECAILRPVEGHWRPTTDSTQKFEMMKGISSLGLRRRPEAARAAPSSGQTLGQTFPDEVALEVKQLRERVSHLAVEVFHLTAEVQEFRAEAGSFRPGRTARPRPLRPASPPVDTPDLGLEWFRPESELEAEDGRASADAAERWVDVHTENQPDP